MSVESLAARVLRTWVEDFVDEDTGEVVSIERNEVLLERDTITRRRRYRNDRGIGCKSLHSAERRCEVADYAIIYNTLNKDTSNSEMEAVQHIYRQLRGADAPDEETARGIIENCSSVTNVMTLVKLDVIGSTVNLDLDISLDQRVLTKEDIIVIIKYLVGLTNGKAEIDDIDHLSNRRVRTVGEQLYAQFGVGLARMARTIRERMNVRDNEDFKPVDLINARTLSSVINSFFGTTSCHSSWIKPIHWLRSRISAVSPHSDQVVFHVKEQVSRFVTFTIHTMAVCVRLKLRKDRTLV